MAYAYYETGSLYDISEFTCELIKFHVEEILPLISMYKAQNE